jgi:hypothetical protein
VSAGTYVLAIAESPGCREERGFRSKREEEISEGRDWGSFTAPSRESIPSGFWTLWLALSALADINSKAVPSPLP